MIRPAVWLACLLTAAVVSSAHATWSIVAVDPATGEVGGASATCTPWASAIIGVVPGKGVIVTQAASNKLARYQGEVLLMADVGPKEVVAAITDPRHDPTHARQQHGVAALGFEPSAAGFTGRATAETTGDLQGDGVSVQGNILAGPDVLSASLEAFETADPSLPLAERLLRALEAGSAKGGDRRCGKQTAISAYLVVARPDDAPQTPAIRISAPLQHRGGDNAVDALRQEFDRFADQ